MSREFIASRLSLSSSTGSIPTVHLEDPVEPHGVCITSPDSILSTSQSNVTSNLMKTTSSCAILPSDTAGAYTSFPQRWLPSWLSWRPTSHAMLALAEQKILMCLRSHIQSKSVSILDATARIHTLICRRSRCPSVISQSTNGSHPSSQAENSGEACRLAQNCSLSSSDGVVDLNNLDKGVPIVMIHGMGAGVAMWYKNIDALCAKRDVYAFDVVGFGRSSRPVFPPSAEDTEAFFVKSIESWRERLGLQRFILLGHSMGGYLAYSYALLHPSRISHLILVDPWGFVERPHADEVRKRTPLWLRGLFYVMRPFNPFFVLRAAGPFGPGLIKKIRPDLLRVFAYPDYVQGSDEQTGDSEIKNDGVNHMEVDDASLVTPGDEQQLGGAGVEPDLDVGSCVIDYIYHCNAQEPSGETGFSYLSSGLGWAQHPMIHRALQLDSTIPIAFIYGQRSWLDSSSGVMVKELRATEFGPHGAPVTVDMLPGAGHHCYAERSKLFNHIVTNICDKVDVIEDEARATQHSRSNEKLVKFD